MFFRKKTILSINRQKLLVITGSSKFEYDIPDTDLKNLELINSEKYKIGIKNFLEKLNLKNPKTYVLLSDEITFSKEYPKTLNLNLENEIATFLSEVPVDPAKISKQIYDLGRSYVVVVSNNELYSEVLLVLNQLNWKILGIFSTEVLIRIGLDPLRINLKSVEARAKPNFAFITHQRESKKFKLRPVLLLIPLILTLATLGFFGYKYYISNSEAKNEFNNNDNMDLIVESSESTQSSNSETTTELNLNQKEITFKINNGSGVPGLAGRLKDAFELEGFENITVGNADELNNDNTIVIFSGNISQIHRDQMLKVLSEEFSQIDQSEEESADFNVTITTGILTSN